MPNWNLSGKGESNDCKLLNIIWSLEKGRIKTLNWLIRETVLEARWESLPRIKTVFGIIVGFPGGAVVKTPMQETSEMWVWWLGWKDPLQEEMATHSNILDWEISWTEEPGRLQSSSHKDQTWLSDKHTHSYKKRWLGHRLTQRKDRMRRQGEDRL